ncbi:hypothetical protein [Streptococcus oralis]|uniref:hypothetical protein n=1 Tax=Streptococcus oralis TaxID=1303 RepID=UPI002284A883|nr:hypothetical protein [Streptococcus oralis]MCY7081670.1 hypothetical protein [Streptococcus oralis]
MFTKNKFQYCIYNHERLELHELQKEYQKDKAGTKLKYENQLFCPGCYKVDLVINEKIGKTDKKYYLRMFRNNDHAKYICNLVIPERVYRYLEDELRFIPQSEDLSFKHSRANAVPVKLAFVSTMKKNKNIIIDT